MALRLIWTLGAVQDLESIADYIDRESGLVLILVALAFGVGGYRYVVEPTDSASIGRPTAGTTDFEQSYDLDELLARADVGQGRVLYLQCQGCHSLVTGEQNPRGPNLVGIVGRRLAADPGYSYSDEVRTKDFVWDAAQLDRFLRQPSEILPRSRMTMVPLSSPQERANLIAYLEGVSG
jgi:cytochrome c